MVTDSVDFIVFALPSRIQAWLCSCRRVVRGGRNGSGRRYPVAGRRCPVVGRRAPGRSSTDDGENEGEELDEAVAMSLTGDGDELDENGVEELGDVDHDG
jgi:hypothetical protein